jgi:nuclease HARBI1
MLSPFRAISLTPQMKRFNSVMGYVRKPVEWGFGKILNVFAFVDFHKNMKTLQQPVGKIFLLATLFTNCHTCCYGSEVNLFFQVTPPTLEQYLQTD